MAFILKCDPVSVQTGRRIILETIRFRDAKPTRDDLVYVWFSETAGGAGLAAICTVEAVSDDDPIDLAMQVTAGVPETPLGVADLKVHRDLEDGSPISGLARKLYRHSLNKIAELDPAEAAYLAEHWPLTSETGSKYDPLRAWLSRQSATELVVTFEEIEALLAGKLPNSAERPQFWANTVGVHTNVQREAWRAAGYDAFLIKDEGKVRFVKA